MQTVTDEYITAMRSGSRTDRITGTIALADGTVIDVTDAILVNGNLSIDERCMNSFDIGTFYTNQMKLAIYDKDALSHEFANAMVELCYGLLVGDDYEDIFLGKYTVDGTNCKRVRDRVYLTAYDRSAKFDRAKSEQAAATAMPPYNALQLICSECSVVLATTQAEIEAMPNGTLSIKCDSSRIETMRDCVMWIAGLLGGYARINREGKLEIRKAKYSVSADDQSQIIIDRTLNGKERISTSFSDTRIYPKYMEAYCAGKAKVYTSSYVSTDVQARAGSFSLPENPLISSLSEEKQNAANKAVLAYLDSFKQRTIKTTIYGDPALECGDTIKLTGGSIDVGRNIVGVVTRYTWKFRQQCTVQCAAPDAGEIKTETDVSTLDAETVTDEETGVFVKPKAQSEKKATEISDAAQPDKFSSFVANSDGTYTYNGTIYGFEVDDGGYINKVYDNADNYTEIDTTNAAVNSGKVDFNTLVLAGAIYHGICPKYSANETVFTITTTQDNALIAMSNAFFKSAGYLGKVDWGDGIAEEINDNSQPHVYEKAGTYKVVVEMNPEGTVTLIGYLAGWGFEFGDFIKMADNVADLSVTPGKWKSFKLNKTITAINVSFFAHNDALRSVSGIEHLVRLGSSVFLGTSNLVQKLVFPNLEAVDDSTFSNSGIMGIDAPKLTSGLYNSTFQDCANLEEINFPILQNLNCGVQYANNLKVAHVEGLTTINSSDFSNKTNLTIYVSTTLQKIAYSAFQESTVTIEYSGTQDQWDSIEKDVNWDNNATITVHCNG